MLMGGTMDFTPLGQLAQTITTGNCTIGDYYPWVQNPNTWYYHTVHAPVECSGDVHVFPCPHCEKCKCGKATVKRDGGKKK